MMASRFVLSCLALLILSNSVDAVSDVIHAKCKVEKGTGDITGEVLLSQSITGGPTTVKIDISNFEKPSGSKVGFHVHAIGSVADKCSGAGGHLNPYGEDHGDKTDFIHPAGHQHPRHLGDLGNVVVDSSGRVQHSMSDVYISLQGNNNIIGKAIVIHGGEDDRGRGGDEGSRTTGNAGPRLGCCIIENAADTTTMSFSTVCILICAALLAIF